MIRGLQYEDLDRVAEIWLSANLQAHDFIPAGYWKENFPAVKEMLPQAEVYVYEAGSEEEAFDDLFPGRNEILGFIGLNGEYIEGIFVCREARSMGVGRKLLEHAKKRKGKLSLNVYQKNIQAVRFYQREGFQIEREKTDENTGEKEYLMTWENRK
ncbi:MAG TPA: GNAT family N-acetyltransferase [Candidatus Mediterraneibacter norfolkensis]|nr:GNAT family N-acetyltransferase [Candidatus Mediterraneibacter norfolkensis]